MRRPLPGPISLHFVMSALQMHHTHLLPMYCWSARILVAANAPSFIHLPRMVHHLRHSPPNPKSFINLGTGPRMELVSYIAAMNVTHTILMSMNATYRAERSDNCFSRTAQTTLYAILLMAIRC